MPTSRPRRSLGFNLIEVMMTVVIMGVVTVIALPNMTDFISDMRISARTNDLLAFLNFARSESARRGARVTVCRSSDQATCNTNLADATASGMLAFVDVNGNGQVDTGDTLVRVMDALPENFVLSAQTPFATGYYFYYRPSGAASSAGTLRLCRTGRKARDVAVIQTGRPVSTLTATTCT